MLSRVCEPSPGQPHLDPWTRDVPVHGREPHEPDPVRGGEVELCHRPVGKGRPGGRLCDKHEERSHRVLGSRLASRRRRPGSEDDPNVVVCRDPEAAHPQPPPPSPPTTIAGCHWCHDFPSFYMRRHGLKCSSKPFSWWMRQNRCRRNDEMQWWQAKRWCQLSCFAMGAGYDGDRCCPPAPNPPTPAHAVAKAAPAALEGSSSAAVVALK